MKLALKDGSPVVLVGAGSDETEFSTTSYAVVTFTQEFIELISKLRKAREEADCYELTKFYYNCEWLNEHDFGYERGEETLSCEQMEALEEFTKDNAGIWQIEPTGDVPVINDDCTQLHVSDYGIKFTAYIKHTNDRIWTERIPYDLIDKLTF